MDPYDIALAFAEIEEELIASMIRNMRRHRVEEISEDKEWAQWQAEQLKALELYKKQNPEKFAGRFAEINDLIDKAIREAKVQGNMDQEIEILEAIKKGFKGYKKSGKGLMGEFFQLNERKLEALIKATQNDFQKGEYAILRMAEDQYRQVIYNAQVYANTGAGTYEKAVDMATKDFLSRGINCIQYANGARHTMRDYADMAIRTANKRAYLAGEGEMRAEWGIATVIVNKRQAACPKCMPFCGKVLIDDVYSGGSRKDGKYPLLSQAIAAGLYHPRCKDIHTTYFPGISTMGDGWTDEELEKVCEDYRQEQKQQYAERQAEKYGRLSKYSLDEDNQKEYERRERLWKEQSTKGRMPETVMNRSAIESAQYKRRVESIQESKEVKRTVWKEMIDTIRHRSGSEYEDLIFIDSTSGQVKRSVDFEQPRTAKPTKEMQKMIKNAKPETLIAIHNHPGSTVPSWNDIVTAKQRKYKYGLVACHDGQIFRYQIAGEDINAIIYNSAVAKLNRAGYNENSLKEFCKSIKDAGVRMEVL